MLNELNDFINEKLKGCKNKKKRIAIQGILTGITLAVSVNDEIMLNKIKELFDAAIDEIVEG